MPCDPPVTIATLSFSLMLRLPRGSRAAIALLLDAAPLELCKRLIERRRQPVEQLIDLFVFDDQRRADGERVAGGADDQVVVECKVRGQGTGGHCGIERLLGLL